MLAAHGRVDPKAPEDGNADTPTLPVMISLLNGTKAFQFETMPDTGATRTVISLDVLRDHGLDKYKVRRNRIQLRVAGGTLMRVYGTIELLFKGCFQQVVHTVNALVTDFMCCVIASTRARKMHMYIYVPSAQRANENM